VHFFYRFIYFHAANVSAFIIKKKDIEKAAGPHRQTAYEKELFLL